jgi:drug/metabolite transporter (DMT)-like permease
VAKVNDYLKLQFIILIWGFTGILGALIDLPPLDLVVYRTALAGFGLGALILLRGATLSLDRDAILKLVATGLIVGLHWVLFFAAIKSAGASVGMIGLSTSTLWSALLAPVFLKQRISALEVVLGVIVIAALGYIFHVEFSHGLGLLLSILAGLAAAVFSFFNGRFTHYIHHHLIAFYEMIGACLFALFCLPFAELILGTPRTSFIVAPSLEDFAYLLALSWLCTVYPYSECVELLKRLSVFVTNLFVNLEPVYGMILAALILKEHHLLTPHFYWGSAWIIVAVCIYPLCKHYLRRSVHRDG